MNRDEMVEAGSAAIRERWQECNSNADEVRIILDAILPQVTTAAQLRVLDPRALVVSDGGGAASAHTYGASQMVESGPLTVVWQPS